MNTQEENTQKNNTQEELNDIWLPHIPKNAGTTIVDNLELHTKYSRYFNWLRSDDDDFIHITNNKTQKQIKASHVNPLEKGMNDWLKILIIRNPIDRFISKFNYFQWEKYKLKKEINIPTLDMYMLIAHITHLRWLTDIQLRTHNPLVHKFTIKNVFDIFDYIIDVSNIQKVFMLIEDNFLQKKIKWPSVNTSEENFIEMMELKDIVLSNVLLKKDLTEEQFEVIYQLEDIQKDFEFYNLAKERI